MEALWQDLLDNPISLASGLLCAVILVVGLVFLATSWRLFLLLVKNLKRNKLRTIITCVATMVLVFMVTLIWTVIYSLDQNTREKAKDLKLIVTERWQLPSQMPMTHADYLNPNSAKFILDKNDVGPNDFMTWSFYGGTLDPTKMTRENLVFLFAMNPRHMRPMMEDLENYDEKMIQKLVDMRNGCLMGRERLAMINKRVGERFKITGINYKGIDLEFEIIGELPDGRYSQSGIMNLEYFTQALEDYYQKKKVRHPLDQRRLNLVWLRVKDKETFSRVADTIENGAFDPQTGSRRDVFADRPVKCETASSLIGNFLEVFKDLLDGMKYLLVPAILVTMTLVVSNAISISVRERRTEMAVLKVLGFRPRQVLALVLGEALLVGGLSGLLAAALTYGVVNFGMGGLPFQLGFFPRFLIPEYAFFWGPAMGCGTALLGSLVPAWSARSVRVSDVFAKVA